MRASSTMIVAPTAPTITTPVAGSAATITRNSGFALAWTGGSVGDVTILVQTSLSTTTPGTPYRSVRCSFPVAAGHATTPAAALASLPAGNASFMLGVVNIASTTVGAWLMNVSAVTYPLAPNGQPFSGGQATVN